MKLLIILAALGKEGISNSVVTYLENMDRTGFSITIGVAGPIDENMNERVSKLGISAVQFCNRMKYPVSYFFQLLRLLNKDKYDIMHVHGNSATLGLDLLSGCLAGVPVRIAHSRNSSCTHKIVEKLMRPLFYATYTEGFAVSKEAGDWLFPGRRYTIIPNGKNLDRFIFDKDKRELIRKENGIGNEIILGHVGAFNRQKNHKYLIDIFYELVKRETGEPKYQLWLFGPDDGEKDNVLQQINSLGLGDKVKIFDYKNNIQDYLSAMDIMIFPSLYEGLPNVVVEWQISGLPCLISQTITKECKVFDTVEYLDIEAKVDVWADRIQKIALEDRETKEILIRKGIADAGYDIKNNAEMLRKKYLHLVKEELP